MCNKSNSAESSPLVWALHSPRRMGEGEYQAETWQLGVDSSEKQQYLHVNHLDLFEFLDLTLSVFC